MEEKKIVMYFKKTDGKNMSISIEDPKDDVTDKSSYGFSCIKRCIYER